MFDLWRGGLLRSLTSLFIIHCHCNVYCFSTFSSCIWKEMDWMIFGQVYGHCSFPVHLIVVQFASCVTLCSYGENCGLNDAKNQSNFFKNFLGVAMWPMCLSRRRRQMRLWCTGVMHLFVYLQFMWTMPFVYLCVCVCVLVCPFYVVCQFKWHECMGLFRSISVWTFWNSADCPDP